MKSNASEFPAGTLGLMKSAGCWLKSNTSEFPAETLGPETNSALAFCVTADK
jgi:hypothetical protein